jgi:hypothetical protein
MSKNLASAAMASGVQVRINHRAYYDTAMLVLEAQEPGKAARYYGIAGSPDVEFGKLKLKIELSGDKRMLWVTGSSSNIPSIAAAYDDANGRFYTKDGVAREAANTTDMQTMHFETAPFPQRVDPTTVVFDGAVAE